jgi:uncharacterized membrane protein
LAGGRPMSRRTARKWAAVAIALSVALWVAQALIGLTYSDDGETSPWFLLVVKWVALALVLASLPVLTWTLVRAPRRDA